VFPQLFGKYVLERELASGGMAVVYLATLRGAGGFEKRLVVKQIRAELASDEAFVRRFVAEAKTTVELSHPNIVPVYELGVEQGVYFIAMELAQGVTLAELLRASGPLSPEEGAYLGVEICRALDYAHRRSGIVHRDVTPRNVLVDDEGAVRVIDFGIAAPVSGDGSPRERVFGSPGHMPLEQIQGGRLTPATDVFAVAALLIEAWTCDPPFRRATREASDAALTEPRTGLAKHDPRLAPLDELIARAVSDRASERPQSAEELARPLRDFLRTADLGDIARRLGERVRRARVTSIADAADGSATPATPPMRALTDGAGVPPPVTPATRPITQPVTETFASREEVVEWIRAPSRPPPAGDVRQGPSVATEPPSTAPLDVGGKDALPQRRRRRWVELGMGVAIVVLGALLLRRGAGVASGPPMAERPRVPSAPASGVAQGTPAEPRLDPSAVTEPHNPPPRVPAVVTAVSAGSVEPGAVSSSGKRAPSGAPNLTGTPMEASPAQSGEEAKTGSATFTITSDLPARATIDGAAVGATPVRGVKRPAGRHVVAVVSVELGEHLSTTVDARPAATLAVHAEFTRPVPVLRVH
jgi:serine/threonine protein kinase